MPEIRNSGESTAGERVSGDDLPAAPFSKRASLLRDRLSELPDLPLAHILSHLYAEEAARTTILSKRFNSLWNSITSLKFSEQNCGKNGDFFVSFVDSALGFHRGSEIEKFSVEFRYDSVYNKVVNGWIKVAVQKQVKSLHLILTQNYNYSGVGVGALLQVQHEHKLPKFLYKNGQLVELVTKWCSFTTKGGINWSSLKCLCISETSLNEGLISRILSGCPVLETLELRQWTGFDRLKVSSSSLRVLRIVDEQAPRFLIQPGDDNVLEISGPNLLSLEVSGQLYRTKVRLSDIGSLVSATMDFEVKPEENRSVNPWFAVRKCWFDVRNQDFAREVLEGLCLVKALTVGGWCIKALSTCERDNLSSPWSERKSLTLCIPVIKWDHCGIAGLLRSSPYLETLIIRLSYCSDVSGLRHTHVSSNNPDDEEYYWKSWNTVSKCPLLHLKTVKVVDFQVSCVSMKPLFQFLEFLLRNSRVLEDVVIQASNYLTQSVIDEALNLVSVPTASPDAVIQFEPPHLWVDPLCFYKI